MDRIDRIRSDVDFLCSEVCAGRKTGSPEGIAARRWLVEQFEQAGLGEAAPDVLQPVPQVGGANVAGLLPGGSERTILVAAHYDHLGRAGSDAFWGADDNAAALAILLDVARHLAEEKLGRRILFCAFDAEEPPHFMSSTMGSQHFVREPLVPLESIDMMICMDLVGHAVGAEPFPDSIRESVFALGAEKSAGVGPIVDAVGDQTDGVSLRRLGGDVIPPLSDYYAFEREQVPFLFLTCGRWQHYHTVTDTPDKLAYPKIAATADFLRALIVRLSQRDGATQFDGEARDDRASLDTLRDVGALLSEQVPEVAQAAPVLEMLEEAVDRDGALGLSDRQTLTALVGGMESMLE